MKYIGFYVDGKTSFFFLSSILHFRWNGSNDKMGCLVFSVSMYQGECRYNVHWPLTTINLAQFSPFEIYLHLNRLIECVESGSFCCLHVKLWSNDGNKLYVLPIPPKKKKRRRWRLIITQTQASPELWKERNIFNWWEKIMKNYVKNFSNRTEIVDDYSSAYWVLIFIEIWTVNCEMSQQFAYIF